MGRLRCPHWLSRGPYPQQRSILSTSPLTAELQEVLGPAIFVDEKYTVLVPREEMEASPFQERQAPIPSDAWYTDGSSRKQTAVWTALAIQPETDTIWFDTGVEQSSPWAEL